MRRARLGDIIARITSNLDSIFTHEGSRPQPTDHSKRGRVVIFFFRTNINLFIAFAIS